MRLVMSLLVLTLTGWAEVCAQDSARELANILAQKGLISSEELSRVRDAQAEEAVRLLTAVLHEKGLLTKSEMARLTGDGPRAEGPENQLRQAPAPQAPPAASLPTVQSELPVTIYGTLLWNAMYNTGGANIQDIPLLATKRDADPDRSFGMTARQSRFGLRYQGPRIGNARLSGQLELDLLGGKPALGNAMNMDVVRLRLAYGRLDWENFSLEAGQDWSLFAPLNPTSLAAVAIPALSASGNPWIRRPQVRAEFRRQVSQGGRLIWQVAVADPNVGDHPAEFRTIRTPGIGERSRGPAVETRFSWLATRPQGEFSLGLSSHYNRGKNQLVLSTPNGQQGVDSWGVATDYRIPVHRRFTISGEAFVGRALGIFSVGAGQAILPVGTPGAHGVQSSGGWVQAQYSFSPKWQVNAAYGLESSDTNELRTGDRAKNQSYSANISYRLSPQVTLAWEWRRLITDYHLEPKSNATIDHANMAIGYTF